MKKRTYAKYEKHACRYYTIFAVYHYHLGINISFTYTYLCMYVHKRK